MVVYSAMGMAEDITLLEPVIMGPCLLFLGDSHEMPRLEADAIISDPPYGMDWNTNTTRFSGGNNPLRRGKGRNDDARVLGDKEPFDPSRWLDYSRAVLFGANHFATKLPVGTLLVWIKRLDPAFGSFLSDAEVAWMKGGHGVYCRRDMTLNAGTGCRAHPTQKPVGIMAWCMDRAKVPVGATVLDPYMGSGTTGIACIRTGRKFIGIEKDPGHFKTACERIARELDGKLL